MKNVETFLEGLIKLSRETGIVVGGCGCCGSPYLSEEKAVDLERGVYRYLGDERSSDLEFSSTEKEAAKSWCVTRGFKFDLLSSKGALWYTDEQGVAQRTPENFDFNGRGIAAG